MYLIAFFCSNFRKYDRLNSRKEGNHAESQRKTYNSSGINRITLFRKYQAIYNPIENFLSKNSSKNDSLKKIENQQIEYKGEKFCPSKKSVMKIVYKTKDYEEYEQLLFLIGLCANHDLKEYYEAIFTSDYSRLYNFLNLQTSKDSYTFYKISSVFNAFSYCYLPEDEEIKNSPKNDVVNVLGTEVFDDLYRTNSRIFTRRKFNAT